MDFTLEEVKMLKEQEEFSFFLQEVPYVVVSKRKLQALMQRQERMIDRFIK